MNSVSIETAVKEKKPDVLVVNQTKVKRVSVDLNPNLKLVIKCGSDASTIDVDYCSQLGIFVAVCAGKNASAAAELTIGHITSVDRRISEGVSLLHQKKWNKGMFANCLGLKDRTLGLIGFGNVAQKVLPIAEALGLKVIVHTRTVIEQDKHIKFVTLNELLSQSDIVSLHVPFSEKTEGLVNEAFLQKMNPTAVLINTAHCGLVVDSDLAQHLEDNKSFHYAADVFED